MPCPNVGYATGATEWEVALPHPPLAAFGPGRLLRALARRPSPTTSSRNSGRCFRVAGDTENHGSPRCGGLLLRIAKGLRPPRGQGGGSRGSALRLCARRLKPLPLLPPDLAGQAGVQEIPAPAPKGQERLPSDYEVPQHREFRNPR